MNNRLINDNIKNLLKIKDKDIRKCKDNKEFFSLLKKKILSNVNKLFSEKDIDKKINAFIDLQYDLTKIANELVHRTSANYCENLRQKRIKLTGEYDKEYVWMEKQKITKSDISNVEKYGKKNNYPLLVLTADDSGFPVKILQEGEEYWNNAIAWSKLKSPYNDNFIDLINAVNRNETR